MNGFLQSLEPWADAWAANLWRASWQARAGDPGRLGHRPRVPVSLAAHGLLDVARGVYQVAGAAVLGAPDRDSPARAASGRESLRPVAAIEPPAVDDSSATTGPGPGEICRPMRPRPTVCQLTSLLLLAWTLCVVARAGLVVVQAARARHLCRQGETTDSRLLLELCREQATRLRLLSLPEIRLSHRLEAPLLAGIWRPTILLPLHAEQLFSAAELRLILAHELAHWKRRDLGWNWLPTIVGCLYFFHPLVWLLMRCWSAAQEAACDELVLLKTVARPAEYGRLLVKLASRPATRPSAPLATAGVLGTYRNLERRILAMARVKPDSLRHSLVPATFLALAATLGVVPWQLVASAPQVGAVRAAEPAGGERLPGKIFLRADLEYDQDSKTEKYNGTIAVDPNTGAWEKVGDLGFSLRVAPDGKQLAFDRFKNSEGDFRKPQPTVIYLANVKDPQPVKLVEDASLPIWSPDGKQLLYHVGESSEDTGWRGTTALIDLATKKSQKLPIPTTDEVDDWSRQGNLFVAVSDRHPPHGRGYQLYVMHPDGSGERRLTEGEGLNCYPRFSPDGKRIAYLHQRKGINSLWLVNVDGTDRKQILIDKGEMKSFNTFSWSPDGKWLAIHGFDWQTDPKDGKKILRAGEDHQDHIEIIAADGTPRSEFKLQGVTRVIWFEHPEWN